MNVQNHTTKLYFDRQLKKLVSAFKKKFGSQKSHLQIDEAVNTLQKKLFPYLDECYTPCDNCQEEEQCPPSKTCCPQHRTCLRKICRPKCAQPVEDCRPCQDNNSVEKILRNVDKCDVNFETESFTFGNWNNLIREVMNDIEKENKRPEVPLILYPESNNETSSEGLATKLEKCFGLPTK